jgi:hypothetical protein
MQAGNFFTEATVNRCQTPCNSAPVFTNDAAALVCAGADFVYNLGAVDPDGDSLSYSFAESLVAQGFEVTKALVRMPDGPLKTIGDHAVTVALHHDVVVSITVTVVAEA